MNRINHSISQIDLPLDVQILNISVNLARLSQWVYEDYNQRSQLIDKFLEQTANYIDDLAKQRISKDFEPTLKRVKKEFTNLKRSINKEDKLHWAEKALTWANILQHRAKLA